MKLILSSNDGEVLDSVELTSEEFRAAQTSAFAALAVLGDLQAGDAR